MLHMGARLSIPKQNHDPRTVLTFASINGLTSILNCFNSPNDWPSLSGLRLSLGATVRHQISGKRLSEGGRM